MVIRSETMERFELWCKQQEYEINKYPTVYLKLDYIQNTIDFYLFLLNQSTCPTKYQTERYLIRLKWLKDKYMEVKGLC